LDRSTAELSSFKQDDRLVMPLDLVSVIGDVLPIAPCRRFSLSYLRQGEPLSHDIFVIGR
jgi:hypothetical protein